MSSLLWKERLIESTESILLTSSQKTRQPTENQDPKTDASYLHPFYDMELAAKAVDG